MSPKGNKATKSKNLHVLNNAENETCFSAHKQHKVPCNRTQCEQWINNNKSQNCILIATQDGPKTLQEVGEVFGLTRMRICQIEKAIFEKISIKE